MDKPFVVKIYVEQIGHLHLSVTEKEDVDILKSFFSNVIIKAEKFVNDNQVPLLP